LRKQPCTSKQLSNWQAKKAGNNDILEQWICYKTCQEQHISIMTFANLTPSNFLVRFEDQHSLNFMKRHHKILILLIPFNMRSLCFQLVCYPIKYTDGYTLQTHIYLQKRQLYLSLQEGAVLDQNDTEISSLVTP